MRSRTAPIFILCLLWGFVVTKPLPQDSSISRECDEQRIACSDNGFSLDECQEQLSDCQGDGESNLDLSFEVEFKARDIEPRKMARRDDEGREAGLSLGPGPFIPNAGLTPGFTTNSSTSLGANDTVPASTNTTLYMNMTLVTNATTDAYYSTADPYATPDSDPDVSVVGAYYQARYTTVDPYIAQGAYATLTPTTPANIDPTSTSDPTIETDQRLPSADPSESTPPPPPPPPPVDAPGDQDGGEHGKETSEYRTHHDISYLIPGTFGNESD